MLKTAKSDIYFWLHEYTADECIKGERVILLMVCQILPETGKKCWFLNLIEYQLLVYACICTYVNGVFFVCVRVFELPGRQPDNKWKCSPSTAVFNWSNRPKRARSCCPNNKALCSLSLSVGRSIWNNIVLLYVSATTIQQQFSSSPKESRWIWSSARQHKLVITAELLFLKSKSTHLFAYFHGKAHSTLSGAEIIPNSGLIAILKPAAAEVWMK